MANLPTDFEWQYTMVTELCGAVYRGQTELRGALKRLFSAVPKVDYEIVDFHRVPAHLVMALLVTGTNATTGETLNFQACDIVLYVGDQIRSKRSYRKLSSLN